MTKKDYQILAEAFGFIDVSADNGQLYDEIVEGVCESLKADDARFDRETFLDAVDVVRRRKLARLTPHARANPVVRSRSGRRLKPHRVAVSKYRGIRYRKNPMEDSPDIMPRDGKDGADWDDVVSWLVERADWEGASLGDVDGFGYFALFVDIETDIGLRSYIVRTDSQGFNYAEEYDTKKEAVKVWGALEDEYNAFEDAAEGES